MHKVVSKPGTRCLFERSSPCNRSARDSDVQDYNFAGVHSDGGKIVGVLMMRVMLRRAASEMTRRVSEVEMEETNTNK